jgi:hypothetical protein
LKEAGGTPVQGTVTDLDVLAKAAASGVPFSVRMACKRSVCTADDERLAKRAAILIYNVNLQCWAVQCVEVDACVCCAADGVIHTAFMHDGSVSYSEAIKIDCAAITAMTDAMAGTNKPFVMSSGTGGRVTPLLVLLPILRALPPLVQALGKAVMPYRSRG